MALRHHFFTNRGYRVADKHRIFQMTSCNKIKPKVLHDDDEWAPENATSPRVSTNISEANFHIGIPPLQNDFSRIA